MTIRRTVIRTDPETGEDEILEMDFEPVDELAQRWTDEFRRDRSEAWLEYLLIERSLAMQETIEATRAGIARAEANAPEEWKQQAFTAIASCAKQYVEFTADEVWELLEQAGVEMPPTPAALGPVLIRCKNAGLIEKTGELRKHSRFPRRHRELTIWRAA